MKRSPTQDNLLVDEKRAKVAAEDPLARAIVLVDNMKNGCIGESADNLDRWFCVDPWEKNKDAGCTPCIDYQWHFVQVFAEIDDDPFAMTHKEAQDLNVAGYLKRISEHLAAVNNRQSVTPLLMAFDMYIDNIAMLSRHKYEWWQQERENMDKWCKFYL